MSETGSRRISIMMFVIFLLLATTLISLKYQSDTISGAAHQQPATAHGQATGGIVWQTTGSSDARHLHLLIAVIIEIILGLLIWKILALRK